MVSKSKEGRAKENRRQHRTQILRHMQRPYEFHELAPLARAWLLRCDACHLTPAGGTVFLDDAKFQAHFHFDVHEGVHFTGGEALNSFLKESTLES